MTAYPTAENFDHWWLTPHVEYDLLHAVQEWPGTAEAWELDEEGAPEGTAACGLRTRFAYAGMGSRFAMTRCPKCCTAVGAPQGDGTPVNERDRADGKA